MTKFDIKSHKVIDHKYQPLDWVKCGDNLGEPRLGKRYSLKVSVVSPQDGPDDANNNNDDEENLIDVYSVHLEVKCV